LLKAFNRFFKVSVLRIYRDLYKSRGLKLVVKYFLECHYFDIANSTDTHKMVSKQDMKVDSDYFINSLMYMASWTSVLEETNFFVKNKIMHPSVTYKYIDVGCGKGKAVLVARKNKIVGGDRNNYVGIDFENNLVSIAKKNSLKVFGDEGNFMFADVAYF
jgi:ubiquinone/menaquinone biosynthesis C-methylase UbiE